MDRQDDNLIAARRLAACSVIIVVYSLVLTAGLFIRLQARAWGFVLGAGEKAALVSSMVAHGIVLIKFWMHISADEQLGRFNEREQTPWKRWKLTDEDWRNRERRADYEIAVHDMVERTSTRRAPWILVEANDKLHARIKVLRSICEALEERLEGP